MVSTDNDRIVIAYPPHCFFRRGAVIDKVTKDKKAIVGLVNGFESVDVGMNISEN